MDQWSSHLPVRRNRGRTVAVLIALAAVTAATSCSGSDEEVSQPTRTSTPGSTVGGTGKPATGDTKVQAPQDSLIDFGDDPRPVSFRGGSIPAKAFVQVSQNDEVQTPMPVVFPPGVAAKLSERARNQVRTAVASAADARGAAPRADPFWIQRDADDNVALLVIIDNPTEDDLSNLTVKAELLKADGTSNGVAQFKIPPEQLEGLPAGDAAFFVLTLGKDRLIDPKNDVTRGGVRLDLIYT